MTIPQPDYWEYEGSRRKPRWLPEKPPVTAARDVYVQPPDSGVSVRAATDALQSAPDLDRFTEVFEHTVDDGHGAFAHLHQFLESAANWCHEQGASISADELGSWAIRLEELIEDIRLLPEGLSMEIAGQAREQQVQAASRPSPAAASNASPAAPAAARAAPVPRPRTTPPQPRSSTIRR